MTNILILQPIRPSNPPALRERADWLLSRLEGENPGLTFDICQDDAAIEIPPHPSLYMRHSTVRNYMLDKYLREEHTHVLWVDSDLIDYPAALPSLLMGAASSLNAGASYAEPWQALTSSQLIVAPFALLGDSPDPVRRMFGPNRFYDVGGFIENGNRARLFPPYFDQQGDVIELDSVGCCYLAPADLYRPYSVPVRNGLMCCMPGARYAPPPTDYYVEHWSVMQEAKKRGYRVCALRDVRVVHAWLPDYGLGVN